MHCGGAHHGFLNLGFDVYVVSGASKENVCITNWWIKNGQDHGLHHV